MKHCEECEGTGLVYMGCTLFDSRTGKSKAEYATCYCQKEKE